MTIVQIAILAALAGIIGQLRRGRELTMLAISALVVFWLQPAEPVNALRFWLPFATLAVGTLAWVLTAAPEARGLRQNWPALSVLGGVAVLADLNRYLRLEAVYAVLTPAVPLVLIGVVAIAFAAVMLGTRRRARSFWLSAGLISLIAVFVVLKMPPLAAQAQAFLTGLSHSGPEEGAALSWLGYSYFAFRLMHTIRDRQTGRLPPVTLSEYMNYVIFFPSFTAGPIDRIERFNKDLCAPLPLANEDWIEAGRRLFTGLFKKFVVADLLAVISINDVLVSKVENGAWLWVFLYAYALRLYFDFSGYTDIAIGLGRLMGIRLPENFSAPYLKSNLTLFWNSWHITLTQWFRSYVFNPLTRAMRSARQPFPVWSVILVAQLATMSLIGLWHGITLGFVAWGLWHGVGLFVHNRWSDFVRPRVPAWMQRGRGQWLASAAGIFLTFNYVALGWLFFTLSTPSVAWLALRKLFGLA